MNDEIKEILEDWKIGIETGKDKYGIKVDGIGYTWKELNLLLDYITNLQHTEDLYNQLLKDYDDLQQENEKLKEHKEYYKNETKRLGKLFYITKEENIKLQQRIEKAIEYIEKEKSNYMRSCDISNATNREGLIISSAVRTCDDTLKILRGNNDK